MHRFGRRMIVGACAALVLTAACSSGGGTPQPDTGATSSYPTASVSADRPASTAKLAIISPTNGQVVTGTTVQMKVSLKDATIVPARPQTSFPTKGTSMSSWTIS